MQSNKQHIIQKLRQEANDLRERQRDFNAIQDQMQKLEAKYQRQVDDKKGMEQDYSERVDTNIKLIQGLRTEIEAEVDLFEERRH